MQLPSPSSSPPTVLEGYPEVANVYALSVTPWPLVLYEVERQEIGKTKREIHFSPRPRAVAVDPAPSKMGRALRALVLSGLQRAGYRIAKFGTLVIDPQRNLAPKGALVRMHSGYQWRVMHFEGRHYLCLDHQLKVQSGLSIATLLGDHRDFGFRPLQRVLVRSEEEWFSALLVSATKDSSRIVVGEEEFEVDSTTVIPDLDRAQMQVAAPPLAGHARS